MQTLPMRLAIDEAWKYQGLTYPNPAVGCTVVDKHGKIISIEAHKKSGFPHAEVLAPQKAYAVLHKSDAILSLTDATDIHSFLLGHHDGCFKKCKIYVTLEPCTHIGKTPSCANLVKSLGIEQVVIAQADPNIEAAGGAKLLRKSAVYVELGMCEEEAFKLLHPFILWQNKPYVTYKWAQRLDGTVDGGTISSLESRKFVHQMRSISDLLVIGGNTVRQDRPVLDARLVNGKAPDILILSRKKDFDRTIPLFHVANRNVIIDASTEVISNYKNILIEGGPGIFASVKAFVDSYLCFVAPKSGGTIPFTTREENFNIIQTIPRGADRQLWLR